MSSGNRSLVVDFIAYKLAQRGHSWREIEGDGEERTELSGEMGGGGGGSGVLNGGSPSWHPSPSPVVNGAASIHPALLEELSDGPQEAVRQTLREAGDEFELRYRRAFSDLTSQLHITLGTAYQSFEQVVNELFRDGVNWGRIVAFFSFGGALCVESVDKEMRGLVGRIATWMATYLTEHLDPWIQDNGGWVSLWLNLQGGRGLQPWALFKAWRTSIPRIPQPA
ncbi:bcl-2-like protein 1, partial [Notechis scutatus]|uniref:Bcl-2-like protein 1 n=1 Tax=Notechis scutatus TaxID=8663 RepID=A0A6J1WAR0_9SAUR